MHIIIFDGGQSPPAFVLALSAELSKALPCVAIAGKCNRVLPYWQDSVRRIPTGSNNKIILLLQLFYNLSRICICDFKSLRIAVSGIEDSISFFRKIEFIVLYSSILLTKPDILHIQWATHLSLFERLLQYKLFKTVVSFRGSMINVTPWIDNEICNKFTKLLPSADGYHAVSKAILTNAEKLGATKNKAMVIYPAVSQELLCNKCKVYSGSGCLKILSVGRDHWIKGYPIALDAMAILRQRGVDFLYTIVAGGDKEELKYQIEDLGLNEYVTLIDNLPHYKVLELYGRNDLFLLPSFEEGVANVVLEAMSLGVPVISTICGGMEEVIEDGVNGFLVSVRNPKAIADAIKRFIDTNNHDIKLIISRAKERIRKNHLLESQVQQMIELYKSVSDE